MERFFFTPQFASHISKMPEGHHWNKGYEGRRGGRNRKTGPDPRPFLKTFNTTRKMLILERK
jgi:hypothetical protein